MKKLRLDDDTPFSLPPTSKPSPITPDVCLRMEDYGKPEAIFADFGDFTDSYITDAEMNAFWNTLIGF